VNIAKRFYAMSHLVAPTSGFSQHRSICCLLLNGHAAKEVQPMTMYVNRAL
jgi:hypothetical protein